MKTTINERLKVWLYYKKISQTDFGKTLGKSRTQINSWCSSRSPIPDKYIIETIELFPDLPARWFITGVGKMLPLQPEDDNITEGLSNDKCCKLCEEKEKLIIELRERINDKNAIITLLTEKKG